MRSPADDVTRFWGLASETLDLGASTLVRSPEAPLLGLANFLYAICPRDVDELDQDLTHASDLGCRPRIIVEPDTPAWVEAALLLRGWRVEQEFRLILAPDAELRRSPTQIEAQPADQVDPRWSLRRAMFRADHLEEDARRGQPARPQEFTDAVIRHRQALEQHVSYLCVPRQGGLAGFLCLWQTPEGRGVIEDVFVDSQHRGGGLATGLLCHATTMLRNNGATAITIAAEVGDTPVHLYAGLGFRLTSVARHYASP